jgi:Mycothiol maleylpyruvate isomerase N-terminal domain
MFDAAKIDTLPLFRELGAGLLAVLAELSPEDWRSPTVHRDRDVKDLVAHLLDTAMRRLAMQRDGFFAEAPDGTSFEGLVRFIQRMNREWMDAARRWSPRILMDMMAKTEAELLALLETLPPREQAMFSVAWAGEDVSENWFDIAREHTEAHAHHQRRPIVPDGREAAHLLVTLLGGPPVSGARSA